MLDLQFQSAFTFLLNWEEITKCGWRWFNFYISWLQPAQVIPNQEYLSWTDCMIRTTLYNWVTRRYDEHVIQARVVRICSCSTIVGLQFTRLNWWNFIMQTDKNLNSFPPPTLCSGNWLEMVCIWAVREERHFFHWNSASSQWKEKYFRDLAQKYFILQV